MMKSILPNSRKHDISFHASGKIDISSHIARRLSLAPGDVIDIVQESGELYLCAKLRAGSYSGRHVGRVYATAHRENGTFRTWSKALVSAVLERVGEPKVFRCPCGDDFERDGKTYITIIWRFRSAEGASPK